MFVASNTKSTRSIWFIHITAIIAESLPPFFHGGWYGFCSDRLGWLQEYNMMSDTCAVGLFPWKAWKGVILQCWVVLILDRLFCFPNAPKTSQGLQRKPYICRAGPFSNYCPPLDVQGQICWDCLGRIYLTMAGPRMRHCFNSMHTI